MKKQRERRYVRAGIAAGAWYNIPEAFKLAAYSVTAVGMRVLFIQVIVTLIADLTSTDTVMGRLSLAGWCASTGAPGTYTEEMDE